MQTDGVIFKLLFTLALVTFVSSFCPTKNNGYEKTGSSLPSLAVASSSSSLSALGDPVCDYHQVNILTSQSGPPRQAISVEDLTPTLTKMLEESGMKQGKFHKQWKSKIPSPS
jgi:hypothetical protein